MRRAGLVLAWVAATAAITFVAWQAVNAADSQTSDPPVFAVEAEGTLVTSSDSGSTASSSGDTSSSTSRGSSTSSSSARSTSSSSTTEGGASSEVSSTSTTDGATSSTSTSTTAPESTSTTTGSAERSFTVVGGTVRVEASNGSLSLVSAFPSPGFDMDTKSTGPDEVRVEFESDDHKSEIRIRWDGDFVVELDEDESSSGSG